MPFETIRNKYGVDPYLAVIPDIQSSIFEADDIESGWTILARGLYSILYREEEKALKLRLGANYSDRILPPAKTLMPKEWARAFNIITDSLVKAKTILYPKQIDIKSPRETWSHPIQLSGTGREKVRNYLRGEERRKTLLIVERIKDHADEIFKLLPDEYLNSIS